ncbi:MAG: hypothetical protein ABMB14_38455 [Myxococcota bacterium]
MIWLSWIGCGPEVVLDFEATCAGAWPVDACGSAGCADGAVAERWASAFEPAFAARSGVPTSEVADHARLRSIAGASSFGSITDATYQVDLDWVRFVREAQLWTASETPTDPELEAAWADPLQLPTVGLDAELIAYARAQREIDGCAAKLGVTFDPVGWCRPVYATDPGDDDGQWFRFDFSADLGGGTIAEVGVDLTGGEGVPCRTVDVAD